ncbi:MAG: hypothetical protein ACOYN3_06485 [Acidimicrobiia bacterium]
MRISVQNSDDPAGFEDVTAIMRERGQDPTAGSFSGSTGDIVMRLRELGIYKHKAWVGEVADALFGEAVRPRPSAHRRVSDHQFEILCRAYVLCAAYGYSMEELAAYLHGRVSHDEVRAHLMRGLALLDTLDELAAADPSQIGPEVSVVSLPDSEGSVTLTE